MAAFMGLLGIAGLGMGEMVIILFIVLLIFGAGKIPELGSALGKGISNFKEGMKGEDASKPADSATPSDKTP